MHKEILFLLLFLILCVFFVLSEVSFVIDSVSSTQHWLYNILHLETVNLWKFPENELFCQKPKKNNDEMNWFYNDARATSIVYAAQYAWLIRLLMLIGDKVIRLFCCLRGKLCCIRLVSMFHDSQTIKCGIPNEHNAWNKRNDQSDVITRYKSSLTHFTSLASCLPDIQAYCAYSFFKLFFWHFHNQQCHGSNCFLWPSGKFNQSTERKKKEKNLEKSLYYHQAHGKCVRYHLPETNAGSQQPKRIRKIVATKLFRCIVQNDVTTILAHIRPNVTMN